MQLNRLLWKEALLHKDWYVRLESEIKNFLTSNVNVGESGYKVEEIYSLVKGMLNRGEIPLATKGPNFDKERKVIDTAVIHHASFVVNDSKLLSAVGLVRQYGQDYLNGNIFGYNLRGKAVWSGHFHRSKQVFFAYHWLVKSDGKIVRLLKDEYIGWHAGNWDINTRSVGIVLSGDFERKPPSKIQIQSLLYLMHKNYPQIASDRILKHSDIVDTRCPGKKFTQLLNTSKH